MTLYQPTVTPSQRAMHMRRVAAQQAVASAANTNLDRRWRKPLARTVPDHIERQENERAWTVAICGEENQHPRRYSIAQIIEAVARHFGVRPIDIVSARRTKDVVRPRQVAMYLARELTTRSLPEIGLRFGGRDHTTILWGINKIARMVAADNDIALDIDEVRRDLMETLR